MHIFSSIPAIKSLPAFSKGTCAPHHGEILDSRHGLTILYGYSRLILIAVKKKLLTRVEGRSLLFKLVLKSRTMKTTTHVMDLEQRLESQKLDAQIGLLADRIEQFVTGETSRVGEELD